MKFFLFDLPTDEDIIIVNASTGNKYKFRLALDTANARTADKEISARQKRKCINPGFKPLEFEGFKN